jgi:hypothetical protein
MRNCGQHSFHRVRSVRITGLHVLPLNDLAVCKVPHKLSSYGGQEGIRTLICSWFSSHRLIRMHVAVSLRAHYDKFVGDFIVSPTGTATINLTISLALSFKAPGAGSQR